MTTDEHQKGAYARVNELDLYYEIHGSGQPLVLLPGGFMSGDPRWAFIGAVLVAVGIVVGWTAFRRRATP